VGDLRLRSEPYASAVASELIEELQAEYVLRYGGPDATPVEPDEFAPPAGGFFVGYLDDAAIGCGGFRRLEPGVAEIKRMYVRAAWRRRGLARELLVGLEQAIGSAGYTEIHLMTGEAQPEAIALYESSSYEPASESYGVYACTPRARFFVKVLDSDRDVLER
jgi:GNAT superfamily N-acetyltransferase